MTGPDVSRPVLSSGRRAAVAVLAAVVWAVGRAGVGDEVVNIKGFGTFVEFWRALLKPELAAEFVILTAESAAVTLAYAVLGTALALILGTLGAPALSELLVPRHRAPGRLFWLVSRMALAIPRAVHELLWALLFIQVLGFDPMVAVLAIGIPFGAVTAKVFAETIDEADSGPFYALRSTGASRPSALFYGVLPGIRGELTSFAFYRLECAIRSAAILGVIGAGGIGFQLDLSFETLRYSEIWTLIAALMLLSGLADRWSSAVRRATGPGVKRVSFAALAVLLPLSWRWVELDLSALWSDRTVDLGRRLGDDLWPPRLGPGRWSELFGAMVDTAALSLLALAIAGVGGLAAAAAVSRPTGRANHDSALGGFRRAVLRLVLLLLRAVPAPIWAFLMVLILFPGLWPGAVALGIYNLGVLGRLFAEVIEDRETGSADGLILTGARPIQTLFYGTLPTAAPRLTSVMLYRWEVIVRETVVVGVVGAGGLGQLVNEHLAARDFAAVAGAILALIVVSLVIDSVSASLRRTLRTGSNASRQVAG